MSAVRLFVPAMALCLAACSGDNFSDLRDFMKRTEASLPHQIDPLPVAKSYEPFTYEDFALPDPFRPRALANESAKASGLNAPDTSRPRDVLERYPLDSLRMVGVLQQKGLNFALIRAEGTLYRVKPGDHMGLDFGVITSISDSAVVLKENVQDAAGEWTLRVAKLDLVEGTQETRK